MNLFVFTALQFLFGSSFSFQAFREFFLGFIKTKKSELLFLYVCKKWIFENVVLCILLGISSPPCTCLNFGTWYEFKLGFIFFYKMWVASTSSISRFASTSSTNNNLDGAVLWSNDGSNIFL